MKKNILISLILIIGTGIAVALPSVNIGDGLNFSTMADWFQNRIDTSTPINPSDTQDREDVLANSIQNGESIRADVLNAKFNSLKIQLDNMGPLASCVDYAGDSLLCANSCASIPWSEAGIDYSFCKDACPENYAYKTYSSFSEAQSATTGLGCECQGYSVTTNNPTNLDSGLDCYTGCDMVPQANCNSVEKFYSASATCFWNGAVCGDVTGPLTCADYIAQSACPAECSWSEGSCNEIPVTVTCSDHQDLTTCDVDSANSCVWLSDIPDSDTLYGQYDTTNNQVTGTCDDISNFNSCEDYNSASSPELVCNIDPAGLGASSACMFNNSMTCVTSVSSCSEYSSYFDCTNSMNTHGLTCYPDSANENGFTTCYDDSTLPTTCEEASNQYLCEQSPGGYNCGYVNGTCYNFQDCSYGSYTGDGSVCSAITNSGYGQSCSYDSNNDECN